MKNLLAIMRRTKLFDGFSPKDCETILSIVKPNYKSFLKNEVLIQDGDMVNYVGLVCSGKIITAKLDYEGNASLLYMLEPPKTFGLEIAATPTQISSITVTGAEATTVAIFPYTELTTEGRLSNEFRNKIMNNMLTLLANENMRRMYKIELLCHKSLRERVLTYLRFVARKKGTPSSFTIPFNRDQLAQYLNVNRSALSHELALMQQEGLITFFKNKFTLHI
ncbi:MAG: Crp/Fnr family transcriptional regulator [Bacillota bacterium]|jgi:CRP-like cAMP-binding protein